MGHLSRTRAVAVGGALLAAACGDPLLILGDPPGLLRIVAGIPDTPGSALDTLATSSRLHGPLGLAVGADEVLYIADHESARVLAVEPSGSIRVVIDRAADARLGRPAGLALDGGGGLLIADPAAHRVWRFDLAARQLDPLAGTGAQGTSPDGMPAADAALDTPTGVAAGDDGHVYFSETLHHRVRAIDPAGVLVTVAGTGTPGFGGDGGPAPDAQLWHPLGVSLHGSILYVADAVNHRIRAIDLPSLQIVTLAGVGTGAYGGDGGPATEAHLNFPEAVAVTPDGGTIFIADSRNHRIRVVNLSTLTLSTFAGTGTDDYNGDLLEAGATALREPAGLAVSPSGILYLSDTGHHIVRRSSVLITP